MAPRDDEAVRELARGFELMRRLQALLSQMPRDDLRREPAGALSSEVLRSLTVALCILEPSGEASPCLQPPDRGGRTSSEGKMEKRFPGPEKLEKRNQHSRTELTAAPHLDGHQWRKYGQKRIAGADVSRSYYRCTYSDVDGCKATKHVQQDGDQNEPLMFRVKYNNEHTCRNRFVESPTESCSLGLIERSSKESLQNQGWISFGASNIPESCDEPSLLSFSSSSSSSSSSSVQDEPAASRSVFASSCWCWECVAPLETLLEAFLTGPNDEGSLVSPDSIISPELSEMDLKVDRPLG